MKTILLLLMGVTGVGLVGCGAGSPRFTTKGTERNAVPSELIESRGIASYYADEFNGKRTSNGELYDMNELTAAHRDLPFNTKVRVHSLETGRSVVVRINDRGPLRDDRIIDLSLEAAKQLGMIQNGTAQVKLEILELGTPLQ